MYKSSEPVLTEFGFSKRLPYYFFMMFHWSRTLETLTQLDVINIGDAVVPNLSIIVDLLWCCLIACLCEEEARLTRREVMF